MNTGRTIVQPRCCVGLIRISDDGPGFPPDILDRIGEPYAQSRVRSERKGGGGLGLGLFITKTLLERSGAALKFSNGGGVSAALNRGGLRRRLLPKIHGGCSGDDDATCNDFGRLGHCPYS